MLSPRPDSNELAFSKHEEGASAGNRTRVQALATPGDNRYTTLATSPAKPPQYKRLLLARLEHRCAPSHTTYNQFKSLDHFRWLR